MKRMIFLISEILKMLSRTVPTLHVNLSWHLILSGMAGSVFSRENSHAVMGKLLVEL